MTLIKNLILEITEWNIRTRKCRDDDFLQINRGKDWF